MSLPNSHLEIAPVVWTSNFPQAIGPLDLGFFSGDRNRVHPVHPELKKFTQTLWKFRRPLPI